MKKTIIILLLLLLNITTIAKAENILQGDERLSCEAILCLSSPHRPSECSPSLDRFFSIRKRKWSDTINARINFLNICPEKGTDINMNTLVNTIGNAAGLCSASELNNQGRWVTLEERISYSEYISGKRESSAYHSITYYQENDNDSNNWNTKYYKVTKYWKVNTQAPYVCHDYWHHVYTDFQNPPTLQQTGNNPWDIRWVE